MKTRLTLLLCTLLFAGTPSFALAANAPAQDTTQSASAPPSTYKLTFVVTQLVAGKIQGRRTYSTLFTPSHDHGSLRAGNRVPMPTGGYGGVVNNEVVSTQYTYIDVGVNIDFRTPTGLSQNVGIKELPLDISAEVSSYASSPTSSIHAPLIRSNKWESDFVLSLDKPTLLFSSDDPAVDQTTQVELTVTRVKSE